MSDETRPLGIPESPTGSARGSGRHRFPRGLLIGGVCLLIFDVIAWWMLREESFQLLEGHVRGVNDVAFQPDGTKIASASDDQTVRLWSSGGKLLQTLNGHRARVTALKYSPDGKDLVSAAGNGEIRVWDAATGIEKRLIEAHTDSVQGVAIGANGVDLYAVGWDSTASLWDLHDGRLLSRVKLPRVAECCSLVPDESALVLGCVDGEVRVWKRGSKSVEALCRIHRDQVKSVAFSRDGQRVLSCGRDHQVAVWSYPSGQPIFQIRCAAPLRGAVFFDDERKIVACGEDGRILLIDVESQRQVSMIEAPASQLLTLAISQDGSIVTGGYSDGPKAMIFSQRMLGP